MSRNSSRKRNTLGAQLRLACAALLLLLAFPAAALADFTTAPDGTGGLVITGYQNFPGGALVIPGTIGGLPVTSIADDAFIDNSIVTSVTIPNGVTSIGNRAFEYSSNLTGVTIPGSVTSIGNYAFDSCNSLANATIPNGVITIGDYAFRATALTSITIPNSVTSIGEAAFAGTGLTSITIPTNVTIIGATAFGGCRNLTAFTVDPSNPNYSNNSDGVLFDKNQTTLVGYPAGNAATDYTIPNSVTAIGDGAFYACSKLVNVTISDSVITIGNESFESCVFLTSITIPSSVTTIGVYAFGNCSNLASMTIPNSVTSVGQQAFDLCQKLTSVIIPDSVTSLGTGVFEVCTSLTTVKLPKGITSIPDQTFDGCYSLSKVTIPANVTNIGGSAFGDCHSLTSVTIPDGVVIIGETAFNNCIGLTNVTIPASVTQMGAYAFYHCTNLTRAVFNGNAPTLFGSSPGYVFENTASSFAVYHYRSGTGFASSAWNMYQTFDLGPGPQTISAFNPIPNCLFGAPPFEITPPTANSGLPVSVTVLSGPATISDNTVTVNGTGKVVLAANQAGNKKYAAAPQVTTSFIVSSVPVPTAQTIAPFVSISPMTSGADPFTITPPSASSGLPVTVTVQSGPATISNDTITLTGTGTVVLAADQSGNASYAAAPTVTTSFVVNPATTDVFNGTPLGDGWNSSSWFGTYNSTYYPWIYRTDLGFIYVDTTDNTNLYLYVMNGSPASMGWLYTTSTLYPNLYSFTKNCWLYFSGGTSFYNYSTQSWEAY